MTCLDLIKIVENRNEGMLVFSVINSYYPFLFTRKENKNLGKYTSLSAFSFLHIVGKFSSFQSPVSNLFQVYLQRERCLPETAKGMPISSVFWQKDLQGNNNGNVLLSTTIKSLLGKQFMPQLQIKVGTLNTLYAEWRCFHHLCLSIHFVKPVFEPKYLLGRDVLLVCRESRRIAQRRKPSKKLLSFHQLISPLKYYNIKYCSFLTTVFAFHFYTYHFFVITVLLEFRSLCTGLMLTCALLFSFCCKRKCGFCTARGKNHSDKNYTAYSVGMV